MISHLQRDFDITVEGDVSSFLGVQLSYFTSPTSPDLPAVPRILLTQPGLITDILAVTGLTTCHSDVTPASCTPLGSDSDGAPFSETWPYLSVVGKLLYLASNSRPDISFAVHQCARFNHAPRHSHALAIKRICRYLHGTSDRGLILTPLSDLSLDTYVDADFAGLWNVESPSSPISVCSRTGYVIFFAGCPVSWVSRLQTEIALSTMEAEYIALSQSMRDLIPMRRLVTELATSLTSLRNIPCRTYSKVFEDNHSALTLANCPRLTPRSKHIGVKYHFFRYHVQNGDIQIVPISTAEQRADIFTKGLQKGPFEHIRFLLLGW
jgi:hypothetical protein